MIYNNIDHVPKKQKDHKKSPIIMLNGTTTALVNFSGYIVLN